MARTRMQCAWWMCVCCLVVGMATCAAGELPAPTLDTRPAFMQLVTNYVVQTNVVVVTNYVVVTNAVVTTNFYNAQGQLLLPASSFSNVSGLLPVVAMKPAQAGAGVIKTTQLQAVRDILLLGLTAASNKVCPSGSFTSNFVNQIQIPQGITSFDRKKTQALLTAMNLTAEKIAPDAVSFLSKLATRFTTDDPVTIIKGDIDAATQLFIATNRMEIDSELTRMVRAAGTAHKLHEAYSDVMLKGGGLLGSVLGTAPTVDIDVHVADGLLKAIARHVSEHEALIRRNASARKTAALREVFKE